LLYYNSKGSKVDMAIKEPVFVYRKYRVSPNVEYIPCLPVNDRNLPTATRIPKGVELTFVSKYDTDLVKIHFKSESSEEFIVLAVYQFVCENVLPIFMRR